MSSESKESNNGTNHPQLKLSILPNLDESVVYGSIISVFLQLPKTIRGGGNKKVRYWNELNRQNKCFAKYTCKLLCVLLSQQRDREIFLHHLNLHENIFEDTTAISDLNKIDNFLKLKSSHCRIQGSIIEIDHFMDLSSIQKMNGIFLMWVNNSCAQLFDKELHVEWIKKLKDHYHLLVGCKYDNHEEDCLLTTCLLWIPSITTFYLPFSKYATKIEYLDNNTQKRIWTSIFTNDQQQISSFQYNIVPLPDTWLDYNLSSNRFESQSLISNINLVMQITHEINMLSTRVYQKQHLSYHHSMADPNTLFCPSSQIERQAFCSLLFHSEIFK